MLKKLFLTAFFLHSLLIFSQEVVNATAIDLKKKSDVFQTLNEKEKEVTLFFNDKVKVKAIRLNEKMQILDSISTERPAIKTYDGMIGYTLNNNNTRLFWSSNNYQEIFTQLFDFNSRKVETKKYSLILKEEKVLQKFSGKENFYILSVVKNNTLKLHIFDKEGVYSEKIIPLNGFNFSKSDNTKSDLYGIFRENLLPFEAPFSLQNINAKSPTSLTDSAKKRKCYFDNEQIIITLDANVDYTQVLTIDLNNFSVVEKIVKQKLISEDRFYLSSNSFYFENKLYQIKMSMEQFYFTIKDLNNNLIKEYKANSTTPIDFKNSAISQEGNDFFGGKKTLESSSQFIRKVNNLNAGIACYSLGENVLITIGGVSAPQQSAGQTTMNQFGLIGSLIGSFAFNPTMESFNSYSNRKVVKIEGLFDANGKHIQGDLQPLAFDKIRTFFDKDNDVSSQTLFKINDYYLGYYDNKTKEYTIRKFVD